MPKIDITLAPSEVAAVGEKAKFTPLETELLAALRDVLTYACTTPGEWLPMKYYRAAQSAIAKAEGR